MTSLPDIVLQIDLPSAKKINSGKVREIYELGEDLLLVTTDRVSAFDVVMNEGILGKGFVLNQIAQFWFDRTEDLVSNHFLSTDVDEWPEVPESQREQLRGRSLRCKRAEPLPVEWVVRGYLTGSGFKDYQSSGEVSGIRLPDGLQHASRFQPPILTPSTKAESGHDLPISFEETVELVGSDIAEKCKELALALYERGHAYAMEKGFVIADTKFEFGICDGEVMLIDECMTPDSSRFWPSEEVRPGAYPESYDKQVIRDYLDGLDWDKSPPPPPLPDAIREKATARYLHIYEALTGETVAKATR